MNLKPFRDETGTPTAAGDLFAVFAEQSIDCGSFNDSYSAAVALVAFHLGVTLGLSDASVLERTQQLVADIAHALRDESIRATTVETVSLIRGDAQER